MQVARRPMARRHEENRAGVAKESAAMSGKETLWPMRPTTAAKHTILRKYLDAWLPILGGGRYASDYLILIDGFAGPGRYSTGEDGSPLLMIKAYLEHSGEITANVHFFFIEDDA